MKENSNYGAKEIASKDFTVIKKKNASKEVSSPFRFQTVDVLNVKCAENAHLYVQYEMLHTM